jgi:hypothetical protein
MSTISKDRFEALVMERCHNDSDFRHEIERAINYGAYRDLSTIAYELFRSQFHTLRESFGLTERG